MLQGEDDAQPLCLSPKPHGSQSLLYAHSWASMGPRKVGNDCTETVGLDIHPVSVTCSHIGERNSIDFSYFPVCISTIFLLSILTIPMKYVLTWSSLY